ncbi:arginine--tRNA ligase [Cohaesibacter gelatinilyticus]|uniref:Arginine--tRNA ligase n=1 Tax=Cohaesibacter gelatinilyticus TaxID=372072 RepID=A0A285NFM1_9HYPH|nr:arginine--tRNA ligase [Cohaesibacter gelatinilyticus]SNZ07757.1 arginyl-tRNA synthetase [Cohaesibacter gelatinilyticus]
MNVFTEFTARVVEAIKQTDLTGKDGAELDLSRVGVEPPRDASHGDLATNAAMVLVKQVGMKPRDVASMIAAVLEQDSDIGKVDVAGPGFINMTLSDSFWRGVVLDILASGKDFGRCDLGKGAKMNVEYVSANPTGPMHVGHTRGAVLGDCIANLLDFAGYDVTREYYINDAGTQVDVLARSAYLRYCEALGEEITIPEGLYPGDYLKPIGQALADNHGDALKGKDEAEWLADVRAFTIDAMMDLIRSDLGALNVRHDLFFSERSLIEGETDRVEEAIKWLEDRGQVYVGKLPPPKGKLPDDWEDRDQTLFRSTDFGDDVDRALKKSDGSNTYFANDIAYHFDKYKRGFAHQVDILGADHGGYVKRLKAAVKAITESKGGLEVKICQLVNLMRDGEQLKMSKRAGTFVTLRDVVEEVGVDAVRFMMMYRKSEATIDFDFAKVTEQSKDNPVFYVQYAHARTASIFRQATVEVPNLSLGRENLRAASLEGLQDEVELALIRKLSEYPRIVAGAAETQEPHRVAFYLYDLAGYFHSVWNKGKEMPQLRFINAKDEKLTLARLALVQAVADVLASGLGLLGVNAPEEMR